MDGRKKKEATAMVRKKKVGRDRSWDAIKEETGIVVVVVLGDQ